MNKFQQELREAIENLLVCQSSTNQDIIESLISEAVPMKEANTRESLWQELATEYNQYIPPTINIIELRKELGLCK